MQTMFRYLSREKMNKENSAGSRTIREIYRLGTEILQNHRIDNADFDSFEILSKVTGCDRTQYLLHAGEEMPKEKERQYLCDIHLRAKHIPLQYILGKAYFYGNEYIVNQNVLIPRQDTETLVEAVLRRTDSRSRVMDMCTGSGAIIITLALNGHTAENGMSAIGVDISKEALQTAKLNRDRLSAWNVQFVESNLFDGLGESYKGQYDVIVSNPPYIPTSELESLPDEVRLYDPRLALDGHDDGLYFYREITSGCVSYLKDGGWLCYEIGCNQAESVCHIMKKSGFGETEVIKDLAGHDRVVVGRLLKKNL